MIKPAIFATLIAVAVIASSLLFLKKFQGQTDPLDEIKDGLGGLRDKLNTPRVIGCLTYTGKSETALQVNNVMVPVIMVPGGSRDTNLLVFNHDATDSLVQEKVGDRNTIWENRSAHYYFRLVCTSAHD